MQNPSKNTGVTVKGEPRPDLQVGCATHSCLPARTWLAPGSIASFFFICKAGQPAGANAVKALLIPSSLSSFSWARATEKPQGLTSAMSEAPAPGLGVASGPAPVQYMGGRGHFPGCSPRRKFSECSHPLPSVASLLPHLSPPLLPAKFDVTFLRRAE